MRSRAPPALRLLFFTASATWRMLSRYRSSALGSTWISYWRTRPPNVATSATPGHLEEPGRDHPVLDLAQAHRVVAGSHEHVAVELADAS